MTKSSQYPTTPGVRTPPLIRFAEPGADHLTVTATSQEAVPRTNDKVPRTSRGEQFPLGTASQRLSPPCLQSKGFSPVFCTKAKNETGLDHSDHLPLPLPLPPGLRTVPGVVVGSPFFPQHTLSLEPSCLILPARQPVGRHPFPPRGVQSILVLATFLIRLQPWSNTRD